MATKKVAKSPKPKKQMHSIKVEGWLHQVLSEKTQEFGFTFSEAIEQMYLFDLVLNGPDKQFLQLCQQEIPLMVGSLTMDPDLWTEVLKHLTRDNLFCLSCASRELFALVWKRLIPFSPDGFRFKVEPIRTILKYIVRAPRLAFLDIPNYCWDPLVFRALTKLQSLNLPHNFKNDCFAFSHLTDLEDLTTKGVMGPGLLGLRGFPALRSIQYLYPCQDDIDSLATLTRLASLHILLDNQELDCRNLSMLTALKDAHLIRATPPPTGPHFFLSETFNFGGGLTSLTKLEVKLVPCPLLHGLTNLTKLGLRTALQEKHLSPIWQLTQLQMLEISNQDPTKKLDSHPISRLTNLDTLVINPSSLTPESLHCIGALPKLTALHLHAVLSPLPKPLLDCMDRLTRLQHLALTAEDLAFLQHHPHLRVLELATENHTPENLRWLTSLTSLTKFGFRDAHLPLEAILQLQQLPKLNALVLRSTKRTDETLNALGASCLTNLQDLTVELTDMTDYGFALLTHGQTQLKRLNLLFNFQWNNHPTIQSLSTMSRLRTLVYRK